MLDGTMKHMPVQGTLLRLLDEAQEVGHQQHAGPENQDSQHIVNQPRRFFPLPSRPKSLHELLRYFGINQPKYYTYTDNLELLIHECSASTLTIHHYTPTSPHCTYTLELLRN